MSTTTKTTGKVYAGFDGRIFRVKKAGKTGQYWAVGSRKGANTKFLDRLGPRPDAASMQAALDAMAARQGWKAVEA